MSRDLSRLFQPRHIAVIGGGAWCEQVIKQSEKMGYRGDIWAVHPKRATIGGHHSYTSIENLPEAPDAAFIGINRHATLEAVAALAGRGAGGAVCFASGFSEAAAEDAAGTDLQAQLLAAAGDMPILGPNCYGFINALDGALLWPDQHGCVRVDKGVAILTQSSNIAINLTMQARGLPLAYVVTCGNMAQTGQAAIAAGLLDDQRVTAIGLHIEGFSDLRAWEKLAAKAWAKGVPLVALKVGKSEQARAATVSHTASLAGGEAAAQALLDRLGIARVHGLPAFLETLKLLHMAGPLTSNRIASISCSGGEASLAADTGHGRGVVFPPLNATQKAGLAKALGPMVALANPLDYHTYIWRDLPAMTDAWSAMVDPGLALTMLIVDYPRPDRCDPADWQYATDAALAVRARTGANIAVVATLPELLPEATARALMAGGVIPMMGLEEAIAAAEAAAARGAPPGGARSGDTVRSRGQGAAGPPRHGHSRFRPGRRSGHGGAEGARDRAAGGAERRGRGAQDRGRRGGAEPARRGGGAGGGREDGGEELPGRGDDHRRRRRVAHRYHPRPGAWLPPDAGGGRGADRDAGRQHLALGAGQRGGGETGTYPPENLQAAHRFPRCAGGGYGCDPQGGRGPAGLCS